MLVLQELQHLAVGAPAGLALAEGRQAEPLEEHLAELLGRVDHELAAGQLPDLVAQLVGAVAHPGGDLAEAVDVEAHAGAPPSSASTRVTGSSMSR